MSGTVSLSIWQLSKMKTLVLSLFLAATAAHASELFSKGSETFKIENAKGQTPTFRILSDSMTKQALAMAAIGALNAQDEVRPKIALTPYVDLKVQTLTLTPEGADKLHAKLKLSGYNVDLDQRLSKKELLSGQTITVKYPKTTKDVAMYTVTSSGNLRLHLEKAKQVLILENVEATMNFESPMGGAEDEAIQFAGLARRVL